MTTHSEQQAPQAEQQAAKAKEKPRMSLHGNKADVMPTLVAERIAARDRRLKALDGWSSEPLARAVDDFNGAQDAHRGSDLDDANAVASAEGESRTEGVLEPSTDNAPQNAQIQSETQAPVVAVSAAIEPQLQPAGAAVELETSTASALAQESLPGADAEEEEDEAPQRGRPRLRPLPDMVKLTPEGDQIHKAMTMDLPLNVHEKLNWLAGTTFGMNKKSILLSLLEPQLDAMLREQGYKVPSFKAKK